MDTSMRTFALAVAALIAVLILAAALLGLLYAGVDPAWDVDTYARAVKYPALLIAAVVLGFGARHWGMTARRLGVDGGFGRCAREVAIWFGIGVVCLLPLWVMLIASGARDMVELTAALAARVPVYLLGAIAVSVLEEFYFRGLLFAGVSAQTTRTVVVAIIALGAVLYALVHLFDPSSASVGQWNGGLLLLRDAWPTEAAVWVTRAPNLTLLCAIGVLLGIVRLRTGRLAPCIGVHAAMVASIKVFQKATAAGEVPPAAWLGTDPYGGYAAALWIGVLLVAALVVPVRKEKQRN